MQFNPSYFTSMYSMKAGIIGTFSALKWIGQRKSSHYLRCTGLQTDGSLILYKLNLRLAN